MTEKQSKEIVELVFNTMKKYLRAKEKVIISGFRTFDLKEVKAKTGRNPQTGEKIRIPERDVLRFKPSKTFYK